MPSQPPWVQLEGILHVISTLPGLCRASDEWRSSPRCRGVRWELLPLSNSSYISEQHWKRPTGVSSCTLAQPGLCWPHFNLICIKIAWPFLAVLRHFHTTAWWQCALRLVCWDTGWLMGLLLKTTYALDLNLSAPWKRNPMPFCLISTAVANCCLPQGSFEGVELLVLSEHSYKYLALRHDFFCLLLFLFSHSTAIIDGSTALFLIPKTPLPECCDTLREEQGIYTSPASAQSLRQEVWYGLLLHSVWLVATWFLFCVCVFIIVG